MTMWSFQSQPPVLPGSGSVSSHITYLNSTARDHIAHIQDLQARHGDLDVTDESLKRVENLENVRRE